MDIAILEGYLKTYGWAYQVVEDTPNTLTSGLELSSGTPILIVFQWQAPWLRISAPRFAGMPEGESGGQYAQTLLTMSAQSRLVKFALDSTNRVILCVDLFAQDELPYSDFALALDVLCHYADAAHAALTLAGSQDKQP